MADEEAAEKSHEPSPKKLEDARQKGDLARSTDLVAAFSYLGFFVFFTMLGSGLVNELGASLKGFFSQAVQTAEHLFNSENGPSISGRLFAAMLSDLVTMFAIPIGFVLVCLLGTRTLVFSPTKIKPDISKISILKNAKQKFGRSGLFEFFKSFVKLLIYGAILGLFINYYLVDLIGLMHLEPRSILAHMGSLLVNFLGIIALITMAIGVIDFLWQRAEHLRKNRMSRKEITDEAKESEGDPHLKQERRSRAMAVAAQQMVAEVPNADVLIVNPTHFSVALKWKRTPGTAPECVAKGQDEIALRMREIAMENGVPIHADAPTARALHASVNVGEEVQPEFYQSVAAAIRFADEVREKARRSV